MNFNNSTRKYIFLCLTGLILISFLFVNVVAKKQDQRFQQDDLAIQRIYQHIQNQEFGEVLSTAKIFEDRQNSSALVNYLLALASANIEEDEKAATYMLGALNLNPYKVEEPIFMLQLAEILIHANMKKEAEIVLLHCESLPVPESNPNYEEHILELQQLLKL